MVRSINNSVTTKFGLCIANLFLIFLTNSASALPTTGDVNSLADQAVLTADSFMQESFRLRMQYEFSGEFLTQTDKEKLQKMTNNASERLAAIAAEQKQLKQQIEYYQQDDWDEKFGQTGLWRKIYTHIFKTSIEKCEIDFYYALTCEQPQKEQILHNILSKIDSLSKTYKQPYPKFIKAKTLTLLASTNPDYKQQALKELNRFAFYSDVQQPVQAAIERFKLLNTVDANELDSLVRVLKQNRSERYTELVLALAFLQRRVDLKGFEKTVNTFPQIEGFIKELVLLELSARDKQGQLTSEYLKRISVFEAELAAQRAWEKGPEKYTKLLAKLMGEQKFQTSLITYTTAAGLAESNPEKCIKLLIKSSKQQRQSDRLQISPEKIAEQAAWLAYELSGDDSNNCRLVLNAFENYFATAEQDFNKEIEFLYTRVLNDCSQAQKSKKMLETIADRPDAKFRNKAQLELAAETVRRKQYQTLEQKKNLLEKFNSIIANNTNDSDCEYADEVMALLEEFIDEIERFELQAGNFPCLPDQLKNCAQFCCDCLDGTQKFRANLFLAEISTLANSNQSQHLAEAEKILDNLTEGGFSENVDLLRCRARLSNAQEKFAEAAKTWAKICRIRKNETLSENERSWKWWRAKCYELNCCRQIPQINKQNLLHTIEVLKNTFPHIPLLWEQKLNSIQQQIKN
ncbi:hypothetical protein ACFL1G_08130 [Planctomycetota bacterium]